MELEVGQFALMECGGVYMGRLYRLVCIVVATICISACVILNNRSEFISRIQPATSILKSSLSETPPEHTPEDIWSNLPHHSLEQPISDIPKHPQHPSSELPQHPQPTSPASDVLPKPPQHILDKPNNVSNNCSMSKRLATIHEKCDHLGLSRNISTYDVADMILSRELTNSFVGELHKVIYCPVYKSGTATMKSLLQETSGSNKSLWLRYNPNKPSKQMRSAGITYLKDYDMDNMVHRLDTYYSFMVVRHPFDRLLSAYYEKFANPAVNFATKPLLKKAIKKRFPNITSGNEEEGARITLEQFLEMVVYEWEAFNNPHWDTFISTCNPCGMRYDNVMMLETLSEDIWPLLDRLSDPGGNRPDLPWLHPQRRDVDTYKEVTSVFNRMPTDILNGLLDIYKIDMEVFGYTWNQDQGAGCIACTYELHC